MHETTQKAWENMPLEYSCQWPLIVCRAVEADWPLVDLIASWKDCLNLAARKRRKEKWSLNCLIYVAEKLWWLHLCQLPAREVSVASGTANI